MARSELAHVRMLRSRNQPGDTERARALLEETLTIAHREGYKHLERETFSLLTHGS